jgi:Na+/glutamate symporter
VTLYGVAIVAFTLAGYANGLLEEHRVRLPVYVMAVLVSAVILLIQDLDRPTVGSIRVNQQPMIDTAASIAAFAK